jgi:potassium-transporting ATPase KdpC subunit
MRRQLFPAFVAFLAFTLLCGVAYPLAVTGVSQLVFPSRADGSPIERNGQLVGSRLLGRQFASPRYFCPRPSAAGDGYDGMSSSASNLGPTNEEFLSEVESRVTAYRAENGLDAATEVPADAVTASGSGLDPHISPDNAEMQAARVARARGLEVDEVLELVDEHREGRSLGFLGEPGVNVLELNLALDAAGG